MMVRFFIVSALLFTELFGQGPAIFTFIPLDPAGEGFDDQTPVSELNANVIGNNTGTTLGDLRRNVLEAAGERWGEFLNSDVPIRVSIDFEDFNNSTTLASASAVTFTRNFTNAPRSNTFYPISLANSLANIDLRPALDDIDVTVNSNEVLNNGVWYYGFDGNTPPGLINFLDVIAHELGHGLGFSSGTSTTTGQFFFGGPDIYSSMIRDAEIGLLWTEMSNAQRVASATNDPNLVWDGPFSNVAARGVNDFVISGVQNFTNSGDSFVANPVLFGGAVPTSGFSGALVLTDDGVEPFTDAAADIINGNEVSGNIALIDRGNEFFDVKVSRAQVVGATAVILANNVDGDALISPTASDTADPIPTIPVIFVSENTGNTLKTFLSESSITVTLFSDTLIVEGEDGEVLTQLRLNAPSVLQPGSSVSHWATAASPNLLMEPAINRNLAANLDLSTLLMKDIGWSTRDITIPHLTYELWLSENDIGESDELSGVDEDFDGDGVSNLFEYFFGSNPDSIDDSGLLSLNVSNEVLEYERMTVANDLTFSYEGSEDLKVWNALSLSENTTVLDAQNEAVSVPVNLNNERFFYHLKLDQE